MEIQTISTIKHNLFKSGNDWNIEIKINDINYPKEQIDYFTVEFIDNKNIDILSSNLGFIENDKIVLSSKIRTLKCSISHKPNIEVLFSFYKEDKIVHFYSEHIISIDVPNDIKEEIVIRSLSLPGSNQIEKMSNIPQLSKIKSDWIINLDIDNHLIINVESFGKNKTYFAIGEMSETVVHNDFIFSMNTYTKKTIIPKEVIMNNKYKDEHICCFELVKLDFMNLPNLFFKILVSNKLSKSIFEG